MQPLRATDSKEPPKQKLNPSYENFSSLVLKTYTQTHTHSFTRPLVRTDNNQSSHDFFLTVGDKEKKISFCVYFSALVDSRTITVYESLNDIYKHGFNIPFNLKNTTVLLRTNLYWKFQSAKKKER